MSDLESAAQSSGETSSADEVVIEGTGVSPGIAIGTVHRYVLGAPEVSRVEIEPHEVDDEVALLEEATDRAIEEIEQVRAVAKDKLGPDGEAIFDAQKMMLRDDELLHDVRHRIQEEHESAAHALATVLDEHRHRLETSEDEYLRERTADLDELEDRLLRALQRGKAAATVEPNSIVLADRLTTGDVVRFSRSGMLGCVMARGGRTSHVSIIARALNVPAVVGIDADLDEVEERDTVILDGHQGRLIIHPSDVSLTEYRERQSEEEIRSNKDHSLRTRPATTQDGRSVALRANVEFEDVLTRLDEFGADGIGLMRTEMFFLDGDHVLSEEEQVDVYRRAAEVTGDDGATIRLLDLGGDKLIPLVDEENPFLGWRGVRVLLDRANDLLRPQIRAVLRANAYGSLRVLIPMVTTLEEVRRVQEIIQEEIQRLRADGVEHDEQLPVGIMVETPTVAIQARNFAELTDFMSIGTNDLTQYVLAVDRGNGLVADRFDDLHPAVLQLIRRTVAAGRATGTPIELCGELAADVTAVPILIGLGLDGLSVSPPCLSSVKRRIRAVSAENASRLADAVCSAPDARTVRQRADEWIEQYVPQEGE